ncbi:MYCBP-associated protein-like [Oculina patagonica]
MSNKLSSKPSKKDRPRSTDKSAKSKKRDGGTPDKMSSPAGSAVHIPDELCTGPSVGKVISGDDIDSLAINVEELKKVHPPKRPSVPKPSTTVMVRKTRVKQSVEQCQPLGKSVTVARPAPPDAPLVSTPLVGTTGPLFDEDGQVLTHTILGSWEDFQQEAIKRGDIENLPPFSAYKFGAGKVRPTTKGTKKEKKFSSHVWQTRINESNALTNWQRQMLQRKMQQQHLSNVLNTSTDMLVMNQSEDYRETQENRYAIDRSIPSMDYGKGYRVGSEFWKQVEPIGDDETGINMTLTQTERGYPPAVEHIGKPIYIKNEMGIEWSNTHRSASVHYPWQKSTYLQERTKQLQNVLHELDPHQPYIDELEVIGTNHPQHSSKFDMMSVVQEEEESEILDESMSERDPLANIADVVPQPIFGPSLSIGGHTAQWNGPRTGGNGQAGVDSRVIFEANVGDRVTSHLNICNDGTTAIYFSWKKIPRPNALGTKLAGQTQRFYFDTKSGVILPGDTLKFPFVFKSPNAGIFTETWELMTRPTLCGGAPLRITLRGVAVEDDIYKEARKQIEQELAHREAVETATRLLDEILEGVRTPERARSPVDAYITEEEIFGRANQGMYFQDEVVQELKQIYAQLEEEEDWDLSLQSLQQKIMCVEDEDQRDSLLQTLNSSISTLSFPPMTPVKHAMYAAGYQLLCELVDSIVGQANMIRSILGLPERELVEDTSQEEVDKRLRKGTTSETKAAESRKGDKKDKRGGKLSETDRPTSTQRSKLSAKKSGRGTSTPSSQSKSALSETAAERTGTPASVDGLTVDNAADPVLEAKYREKLFTQAYALVVDAFDRMDIVFDDIKTAELKLSQ